jgi:hypothetical protein
MPTAMVTMMIAARIHGRPIHASQVILPSVRMLLRPNPAMAATAAKTAVHVAWVETAFRPIEMPRMAEPLLKM